jgi:hypothetical protein
MNPEVKTKWVEALRSDKYKQAEGQLKDPHGYCCLGVLCDISGLDEWDEFSYMHAQSVLPNEVAAWAELDNDPAVTVNDKQVKLSFLNDSNSDFTEIADLIERYL